MKARHLFLLARDPLPHSDEQSRKSLESPTVYQTILDGWGIYPALLVDRHLDVLARNESVTCVFGDFSHRSERGRSAIWSTFMDPAQRECLVPWEQVARRSIALLRALCQRKMVSLSRISTD